MTEVLIISMTICCLKDEEIFIARKHIYHCLKHLSLSNKRPRSSRSKLHSERRSAVRMDNISSKLFLFCIQRISRISIGVDRKELRSLQVDS